MVRPTNKFLLQYKAQQNTIEFDPLKICKLKICNGLRDLYFSFLIQLFCVSKTMMLAKTLVIASFMVQLKNCLGNFYLTFNVSEKQTYHSNAVFTG